MAAARWSRWCRSCLPRPDLSGEMSLGDVVQVAAAFVAVQNAFNWVLDNFMRIAEWLASALVGQRARGCARYARSWPFRRRDRGRDQRRWLPAAGGPHPDRSRRSHLAGRFRRRTAAGRDAACRGRARPWQGGADPGCRRAWPWGRAASRCWAQARGCCRRNCISRKAACAPRSIRPATTASRRRRKRCAAMGSPGSCRRSTSRATGTRR